MIVDTGLSAKEEKKRLINQSEKSWTLGRSKVLRAI
jgi:hypothetical protein